MTNNQNDESCCSPAGKDLACCRVEALVSIDERGQMVLPKETREKAGIKAGDKLAIISSEKNDRICCLTMIKADELMGTVKDMLGPMLGDLLK